MQIVSDVVVVGKMISKWLLTVPRISLNKCVGGRVSTEDGESQKRGANEKEQERCCVSEASRRTGEAEAEEEAEQEEKEERVCRANWINMDEIGIPKNRATKTRMPPGGRTKDPNERSSGRRWESCRTSKNECGSTVNGEYRTSVPPSR